MFKPAPRVTQVNFVRFTSLRFRVPAAIALAVIIGVGAFGALAYRFVSRSVIAIAEARAQGIATQIVQSGQANAVARERRFRDAAAHPALLSALRGPREPGAAQVAAARAALAVLGPDTGSVVDTELRDTTGRAVVTLSGRVGRGPGHPTSGRDTAIAGPLFASADSALIEYGAPVMEGGRVIGRLSQVRVVPVTQTVALQRLRDIVGDSARILTGNADGSLWLDQGVRVMRPPASATAVHYVRDGVPRVGVSALYPGAPHALAIEFREDLVLAPARRLLGVFVISGLIVTALGAAAGLWFTAGFTGDITRLTKSAEAIAEGDLGPHPLPAARADEVGRLARAFDTMRGSVKSAHDSLEHQVNERTAELRRAQDELVQKERLATLGQLSSSVGHELRNPLGVMTNAIYFLEMTLPEAPPKVREYLGILRTQVRTSEKIVADLLDFARVRPPQRGSVVVADLVREAVERSNVPYGVRVDSSGVDPSLQVNADAVQVGQVLLNLITNAAQAMDVTGGLIRVCARVDGHAVRIDVTDSGPGVPDEELERIFEPLYTTKARGIGLGLSVSRSLVEGHGGLLTVSSGPGEGATFTFTLPGEAP